MAAGQRPINNVVDITNYVMLLDRASAARVRPRPRRRRAAHRPPRARDGERMTTLDGQERVLDAQMGLIADADGPTSIAGVMGGQRSEVEPGTTRVLMEVATWDGPTINRTANIAEPAQRGLGALREGPAARGLHGGPGRRDAADARADRCAPGARARSTSARPGAAPPVIRLRDARVSGLLGAPVARERSAEILTRARLHGRAGAPTGSTSRCRTGGATTSRARPT